MGGGIQFKGSLLIVAAQPDIFTTTNDAGGRAAVVNVTNPMARTPEPFSVTSTDGSGSTVPTVLEISLTGIRTVVAAEVKISIVTATGTTDITGDSTYCQSEREIGVDLINSGCLFLSGAGTPNNCDITRVAALS